MSDAKPDIVHCNTTCTAPIGWRRWVLTPATPELSHLSIGRIDLRDRKPAQYAVTVGASGKRSRMRQQQICKGSLVVI